MGGWKDLSIASEAELQTWVAEGLSIHGWEVEQEVKPDNSDYRVDLICSHPRFGKVGIETKHIGPGKGASYLARGHEQITQQYWNKEYNGDKILLWAICPYFTRAHQREDTKYNQTKSKAQITHTREFFGHFGIGYLRPVGTHTQINFGESVAGRKIPAFSVGSTIQMSEYEKVDMDDIRETVRRKRGIDLE